MPLVAREGPNDKRGGDGCRVAPREFPCALNPSGQRDSCPTGTEAGIRR